MKIGIVGSRRWKDGIAVFSCVDNLSIKDVVVSGGCEGVDTWAEQRAKDRGMKTIIFKPNLSNIKNKADMVKRYYSRNKKIAEECDLLIAFVSSDRTGGTENTIEYARELKKSIIILSEVM